MQLCTNTSHFGTYPGLSPVLCLSFSQQRRKKQTKRLTQSRLQLLNFCPCTPSLHILRSRSGSLPSFVWSNAMFFWNCAIFWTYFKQFQCAMSHHNIYNMQYKTCMPSLWELSGWILFIPSSIGLSIPLVNCTIWSVCLLASPMKENIGWWKDIWGPSPIQLHWRGVWCRRLLPMICLKASNHRFLVPTAGLRNSPRHPRKC